MAGFSRLLLFSLDAFYYEQTVRRYQPCFCYSCPFGCFHFQPPRRLLAIISTPFIYVSPLLHASRFTLTPSLPIYYLDLMDRSSPLHCYTFFVLLNFFFLDFFLLAVERRSEFDIIIPSCVGRKNFPLFCSFSYLYPFTIYLLPVHGYPSPTASRLSFSFSLRLRV